MKSSLMLFVAILWGFSGADAQLNVGGQASAAFVEAQNAPTQYSYNSGRPTFAWRADLFIDAEITENILFLSNFRITQNQIPYVDLFLLRFANIVERSVHIEVGALDIPFLNIGERRFPKTNPFYSLPLAREHLTSLRSSDYELWVYGSRYTKAGNGVRLLDGALYDLGAKVFGSIGDFDYAVAVINGSVSSSGSYSAEGLNSNPGFGIAARLSMTPAIGTTIGLSFSQGEFISSQGSTYYGYSDAPAYDPAGHKQKIAGIDIDYSFDHLAFYGEGFFNSWNFDGDYGSDLEAVGYSVEGKYTIMPRLTFSARVGGLYFNDVTAEYFSVSRDTIVVYSGPWDQDVVRVEGAVGYRISRETAIKAVYEWNRFVEARSDPSDNAIIIQVVSSF